jgi:dihydrolipoamide dehydrogenase
LADQFDLVVIGGGPGGYASAFYAASAGMKVALIERDTIGGTCLNRGCIPAKAFLETAAANRHVAHASEFGIQATSAGVDFAVSQARKARIVDGLVKGLTGLTKSKKVTYFLGTGSLEANRTVNIAQADGTSTKIQGAKVILASGSVPRTIKGFPIGGSIMTSDEGFDAEHDSKTHRDYRRRCDRLRVRLNFCRLGFNCDDHRRCTKNFAGP